MADWFKCAPLPLLDALQDLTEDGQLVYVKALLVIYHRDGRIAASALRGRFPNWRPKRLQRAMDELIATGMLIGTASGDIHNPRAMRELQSLADTALDKSLAGSKGGQIKARKDRLARKIAERNLTPNMFEMSLKPISNPVESDFNRVSTDFENAQPNGNVNNINAKHLAGPCYAHVQDLDIDIDKKETPCVPLPGTEDEALFDVPASKRRKPSTPMPADWEPPTLEQLTPMVRTRVDLWPQGEFEREREKFITDATAADRRHRDWTMAFGKWCLVHDGYLQKHSTGGRYEKQSGWTVPDLGGPATS